MDKVTHEYAIDRWENEGGSCPNCTADIAKTFAFQQRAKLFANSADADWIRLGIERKQERYDGESSQKNQ
ncbi:hypothetical protein Q31a_13710 [Aureliella helgolandensis]|uniref:Uncharacterized protein n=1 Tax=Aureliella helgolandensis TaxID=2527968 RepID=A0A518G3A6_9BACT|nr:hypothetical protein Q31a_13710 [Aureliella helgolandensis]